MDAGQVKKAVLIHLEDNSVAVKALIDPPFELQEVFNVITEAIELVEVFSPDEMPGDVKRAIVQGVIEWMDQKFGITSTIVASIVPRWLRWLPIKRIVAKIFPAMIELIVSILNKYVWKVDKDDVEG